MFQLLSSLFLSAVAAVCAPAPQPERLPAPEKIAVIRVLPVPADGNYVIERAEIPATDVAVDSDSRYARRKESLDDRFKMMFDLKESLEKQQEEVSRKWEEYYAMHNRYEKQLKRLIADWADDKQYTDFGA